ncbi:MAG: glycosyltransferase family 2 protein [Ferrimicrobium sp.]
MHPKVSVLLPTFNGGNLLLDTISSLLSQDFVDWELIVSDDCSTDNTFDLVDSLADNRVRCFRNESNLGYGGNLAASVKSAQGEIVFLLGQDDLLLPGALQKTVDAFDLAEGVGVVTRPYYWFYDDPEVAVREVPPYDKGKDVVFRLLDGLDVVKSAFSSFGQLSGLAFRRDLMRLDFHDHVFTAHIYPIADILRRSNGVFLATDTVAVRIASSQTRFKPEIYDPPPLATWIEMAQVVFGEGNDRMICDDLLKVLGRSNFVDLVQVRNYSTWRIWFRECGLFVRLRPANVFDPRFVFIVLICLMLPRLVLRKAVDTYKRRVLSHTLAKRRLN